MNITIPTRTPIIDNAEERLHEWRKYCYNVQESAIHFSNNYEARNEEDAVPATPIINPSLSG